MARPRSSSSHSQSEEEPGVGSQVQVVREQGQQQQHQAVVIGKVTAVAHGWFTVGIPGQAPRKCRRGEIRLLSGGSQRATEEEDGQEEEEAIIRLDAPASKKKPPPVTQLQRDAARLASVRLETGLPKPSYLRFDKLGGKGGGGSSSSSSNKGPAIKRASLHPNATRALALPPVKALLPSASAAGKKEREEQERQTQTHHKDPEAEADAKMILMRNYIDPKRFYKNLDSLTPGFQIGTVIEGRMETGPQGRLSRKQRKRTFVDEILADRAVRKYSKRKFSQIQEAAQSGRKGWQKKQQRKHTPKWAR